MGFKRTAFTDEQLTKIDLITGDTVTDMFYIMTTYYMYFPFLMRRVKCGAAALEISDRQNAYIL